jgi:hypothetical protein
VDFDTYIDLVSRSAPADWNVETGPVFLQAMSNGDGNISSHAAIMAFRRDLAITMAYGMVCREEVHADWTRAFPDQRSSMRYLDFFYNSALVFRDVLISVDGGQCVLPIPNPGPTSPYEVPRRKRDIARLVHQITNPMRDFDDYFSHANLRAIDEFWPL